MISIVPESQRMKLKSMLYMNHTENCTLFLHRENPGSPVLIADRFHGRNFAHNSVMSSPCRSSRPERFEPSGGR